MAERNRVRVWAEALIRLHLDPSWSFDFDAAKRRAGQCDFTNKRITLSRYLTAAADDDEVHQTLLHEVAHAMAGPKVGHGAEWRQIAASIGYEGGRLYAGAGVDELAPWVGSCPNGHTIYRHRKPGRTSSCTRCAPRFDRRFVITWTRREITAAMRRAAASSA